MGDFGERKDFCSNRKAKANQVMEKLPPIKGESGSTGYSGTSGYGHAGSAYTIRVGQSEHTYTWSTSGNMSTSGYGINHGIPTRRKQKIVDITSRGRLSKIKPSKSEPEHFPAEPGLIKKAMTMLQNSLYGAFGHKPKKGKLPALSSKLKPIK
jgi:hypothetical protein